MMSKTDAMIEKVKALVNAPSCCAEAKEAGNNWLEAVNTEKRDEAAEKLIAEIEADIIPIDWLIKFAGSEDGQKVFGAEKAAGIEDHAKKIRSEGAKYCDCPAWQSVPRTSPPEIPADYPRSKIQHLPKALMRFSFLRHSCLLLLQISYAPRYSIVTIQNPIRKITSSRLPFCSCGYFAI